MAEYDETFFDRIMQMGQDQWESYLHSLSESERTVIMAAIYRALGQQSVKDHIEYLQMGLRF